MKLSPEQREERKAARRVKRSAFITRMIDEFKKIMVLYATIFVTGFLVWEHIIYANGVNPTLPSAIPVALISGYFTAIVTYCFTAYKEKDSLNKNGLIKPSSGITKVVTTVVEAAKNILNKEDSGAAG